ncbi:hypothetical protein OG875_01725 [Streptomyces sp. NBC_01498]|uniref:hypothetical protein n=1 Tax=Streptomyces sp. NBC_01498 TaxID=2975870 RepID=UPI002E7AB09F|nr:hypothetical protein [Streptomyces sp. NBC_01498]WTL23432.1 hypothetical protein OG875_01725 [Streptomyces sp. NBC_01498]
MTVTTTGPPAGAPVTAGPAGGPERHREAAYRDGPVSALIQLHDATSPGVLPAGPGGHVFVPREAEATCDRYGASAGPRPRGAGADEHRLGLIALEGRELIALRVDGSGPPAGEPDGWATGLAWLRLGLAERLVDRVTTHLGGRTVQRTVTLNLPLVRAMLADAVAGTTECRALLKAAPTSATLRRVHRSLDETGRTCLHLLGAAGFVADGPGSEVRVSELLADTYAPTADDGGAGDSGGEHSGTGVPYDHASCGHATYDGRTAPAGHPPTTELERP